ncbi:FimV/HubP family polar landmark protein [Pandoraea sp. SD6-2]|uniref:FimV/HubP family polar landmark protein n=1 Tax=Pandoraea sp. SD6-2 TaxID=1286093 RepID=UPI00032ED633|nr:FimV/HubP family polar landmark protein [Pandoraea sp. SD6-2]EON12128.1 peptidoglycan-binding LysM [Pandoraea sp. SD6-2]
MRKYSIGKRANSSRNSFRLSAAAAVLWSLGLLNAGAAEFGPQQVRSGPGQPLRAVIVLGNVSQAEADGLSVKLAPRDAFRQAGLRYDPTLEKLSVSVTPTAGREPGYSGTYLVHVDSAEPVSTSFLDLLLVLEWRTGRQSNAVTLSAIPEASAAQPQAVVPAQTSNSGAPATATSPASSPAPAPAPAASAQPGNASGAVAEGARKVGRGDSLSSIAREFTGGEGGATLAQMMTALFESNRSAFIGDDPNRLRQGATLTRPADAQVQSIPPAQARKFVSSAREQFDAYRARLAESTAQQAAPAGGRSAQGAIEAGKAPEAAAPATRDELKLSRPGKGGAGGKAGRTGGSEEEQIAQGKAQAEAQGRVNELQKNVADLQKLLAMKNQAVANLEEQAAAASGATAQDKTAKSADGKTTTPAAAAAVPNTAKGAADVKDAAAADSPATAAVASEAAATDTASAASASATASDATAAVAAPASEVAAASAASAPTAESKPAPNAAMNWRAVTQNPYVLPGAGALVVLLGLWWLMRRRRAETPAGQPGPYDDGHDAHAGQDHDAPHDGSQADEPASGVATAGAVAAAGAVGAAALYAANQAEADEHLHPAAEDTRSASDDGVAAVEDVQPAPEAAEASVPEEWDVEPSPLDNTSAEAAHAEGSDNSPVTFEAPEVAAEPLVGEVASDMPDASSEAASEPEIDWNAAFAEQAGEAGEVAAAHDDPAAATLSSLEALDAAAAIGGVAAAHTAQAEPTPAAPVEAAEPAEAMTPIADATPDGGVAGMVGDLDLAIPGQPAHVGTISNDALPSLSKGLGSVQFKMEPKDDPSHPQTSADEAGDDTYPELSDADFDAAMEQAHRPPEAPRSYTDTAHEAPSLKPLSFDLSDFSLDLKGDEASAAPSFVSAPALPADIGVEALVEHETLDSTPPETPFAAEPAAPQVPQVIVPTPEPIVAGSSAESAESAAPAASATPNVPDEFHTKLELAVAYQTIGDDDGARELLEEVIAGGDAAQQSAARTRLAELGK